MPEKLIIFDYSGTLSMEMAAFARPDNLMKYLKSSGLFKLGVDSAALFWEIVNTTWADGSITGLGYKKVMRERICELFPETAESRQPEVKSAVSNFVDAYLDHSLIDEHWRSILQKLSSDESVQVIIATDHYAEATNVIIRCLGAWNIQTTMIETSGKANFIVANSADIGAHKTEKRFWEAIKADCCINVKRVLLIDDFGQNEQQKDEYGEPIKVNERRQMTAQILRKVFAADVESISFSGKGDNIKGLIAETLVKIDQFILCGGK